MIHGRNLTNVLCRRYHLLSIPNIFMFISPLPTLSIYLNYMYIYTSDKYNKCTFINAGI